MRLIDADALREQIERCYCDPCEAENGDYNHVRCRACEVGDTLDWIDDCPTIDPESLIPHGRWEEYIEFSDGQIGSYCSECHHGATYFPQRPDRYCRGCGAKMDKEG